MPKMISLLALTLSLVTALHPIKAQEKATGGPAAAAAAASSDRIGREQDGLIGPVRRVRTEVATLIVKSGQLVEGPRKLQGTILYDRRGNKIDDEYFMNEEDNLIGKEVYRKFDEKGNVVEMERHADDGSVISRETYSYQYDAIGNWTKMTTSVGVVEGGKLSYEPIETTYRTITYYSTDVVDRAVKSAPSRPGGVDASPAGETPAKTSVSRPAAAQAAPADEAAPAAGKTIPPPSATPAADLPGKRVTLEGAEAGARPLDTAPVKEEPAAKEGETPKAATPLVKNVSSEELNRAAVYMPQPVYPTGAAFAKVEGRVEVQVLVDEQGEVASTWVVSGHPLLADAAEQAARHARFSPTRLSSEPARVLSLLSYDFKYNPPAGAPPAGSPPPAAGATALTPGDSKPAAEPAAVAPAANAARTDPEAKSPSPADAEKYAQISYEYSKSGKYKEAAAALKEAIRLDPDSYKFRFMLGNVYIYQKREADALDALKKAVKLKPDADAAHYYMGVSYFNLRRYHEAIKSYKRAIQLKQGSADYHFGLGMAYLAVRDVAAARNQNKILKELDPKLAGVLSEAVGAFSVAGPNSTGGFADRMIGRP